MCHCLPLRKPSVSTIDSLKLTNHAHHVKMDILSFIHDLILKAIVPHSEDIGFELELLEVELMGCKILERCFPSKISNVICWRWAIAKITWILRTKQRSCCSTSSSATGWSSKQCSSASSSATGWSKTMQQHKPQVPQDVKRLASCIQ